MYIVILQENLHYLICINKIAWDFIKLFFRMKFYKYYNSQSIIIVINIIMAINIIIIIKAIIVLITLIIIKAMIIFKASIIINIVRVIIITSIIKSIMIIGLLIVFAIKTDLDLIKIITAKIFI